MEWCKPKLVELSNRDPKTRKAAGADCDGNGISATGWCYDGNSAAGSCLDGGIVS